MDSVRNSEYKKSMKSQQPKNSIFINNYVNSTDFCKTIYKNNIFDYKIHQFQIYSSLDKFFYRNNIFSSLISWFIKN